MSLCSTGKRSLYAFFSKSVIGNMVRKLGCTRLKVKSMSCSSVGKGLDCAPQCFYKETCIKFV